MKSEVYAVILGVEYDTLTKDQKAIFQHLEEPVCDYMPVEMTHFGECYSDCGAITKVGLEIDDDGFIVSAGWETDGCAVCRAAASMTIEQLLAVNEPHQQIDVGAITCLLFESDAIGDRDCSSAVFSAIVRAMRSPIR